MAWQVEWSKAADKDIARLGHAEKLRIVEFMQSRIAKLENPRTVGQALTGGKLEHLWRYRMGDYRILVSIQDTKVTILVVALGHRSQIYR